MNKLAIEKALNALCERLLVTDPVTAEYAMIVEHIEHLNSLLKMEEKPKVSPDVLLSSVTSLLGIGLIIKHEEYNALISKALSFVIRPKI